MCPRGARLLSGQGGLLAAARLACHCLLIEGAEGLVLVDTGFGIDDTRQRRRLGQPFNALVRPRLEEEETATTQLGRLGFAPGDVRHIVTTHLDLDHAGGLADFPDAEVHLLGRELNAALHPSWRERLRYVAVQWAHGPRWVEHESGGEEWLGFESVRILPGSDAEILLIPLIGHTRGHTGVAIKRPEGWLLHCGDAFFYHGEIETPSRCPAGMAFYSGLMAANDPARRQNRDRLRELAARQAGEVELICSHDPIYLDARQAAGASGEAHAV
jgi:glyoxylase-like metal-dependent hydrolase (beta-lactamase superfamily II)